MYRGYKFLLGSALSSPKKPGLPARLHPDPQQRTPHLEDSPEPGPGGNAARFTPSYPGKTLARRARATSPAPGCARAPRVRGGEQGGVPQDEPGCAEVSGGAPG